MSVRYHSVGPFEVLSRLGSGGMADVLKAVDGRDGRVVALKIPRADPGVREAERAGARIQQQLSEIDTRVPRVYEIHESVENEMYIAMEYVEGEDLSERIRRGPMEPREAVRIAVELCELLCTAQGFTRTVEGRTLQGIVHGDLKPRNIRLEPGGGVKVLDFGIAKALSLTRPLTRNEFGSLPYSSPERIESGTVDVHSDLWSVSVVLYEMITGQQPFLADSTRRLEQFIRSRARPEPLPEGCPEPLAAVLRKALAPALERRYSSAAVLRDDLRAFVDGRPTLAQAEGPATAGYEETRRTAPTANGDHDLGDAMGDTRRTLAVSGSGDRAVSSATQRTLPLSQNGGQAPAAAVPTAGVPAAPARPRLPLRIRWRWLLVVAAIVLVFNEVQVSRAARELEGALPGIPRGEAESVWKRYREVGSRSFLGVGAMGLADDVREWYVAAADELIADYRSGTPVIREGGWLDAVSLLGRAASIAPRDRGIRARILYCRGQLARINAQAAVGRRADEAQRLFNEATTSFEEAVRLRPRWVDPHLGLARTYIYGLEDPDRAREALGRAEQDGYQLLNRDLALLGDGYRLRAERTWSRARDFRGQPQEDKYLDALRDDCGRALEHYETIPAHGEVSRNTRKVHALLEKVEAREDERRVEELRKAGLGILAPLVEGL